MSHKTWTIAQLQYFPQLDGYDKVVYVVNWILSAEQDGVVAQIADVTNLELDSGSGFTPFDKLTQDQVLGWVFDAIGEDQIKIYYEEVDKKLDAMLQPILVAPDLPWAPKGYVPIDLT